MKTKSIILSDFLDRKLVMTEQGPSTAPVGKELNNYNKFEYLFPQFFKNNIFYTLASPIEFANQMDGKAKIIVEAFIEYILQPKKTRAQKDNFIKFVNCLQEMYDQYRGIYSDAYMKFIFAGVDLQLNIQYKGIFCQVELNFYDLYKIFRQPDIAEYKYASEKLYAIKQILEISNAISAKTDYKNSLFLTIQSDRLNLKSELSKLKFYSPKIRNKYISKYAMPVMFFALFSLIAVCFHNKRQVDNDDNGVIGDMLPVYLMFAAFEFFIIKAASSINPYERYQQRGAAIQAEITDKSNNPITFEYSAAKESNKPHFNNEVISKSKVVL